MKYNYESDSCIQKYRGIPNRNDAGEKSLWKIFVGWFKKKLNSADETADAMMEQKRAEAYKTWAEARKAEAEAKLIEMQASALAQEIAEKVIYLEEKKLTENPVEGVKKLSELSEDFEKLKEAIKLFELIYGGKVIISVSKDELLNAPKGKLKVEDEITEVQSSLLLQMLQKPEGTEGAK